MANIVAIVGRPNVGKSTLFNRLVGYDESITDNQSGITRDRHYGSSEWIGKQFTVVDTGGYVEDNADLFSAEIRKQVQISLEEADVILFVVDCRDGLTDMDKDFAAILRVITKPVLLVANKADNAKCEWMAHEFHSLGMGEAYPISANSGTGTGELLDAVVDLFQDVPHSDEEEIPRIAVLGKPNVGKSSFVNVLLDEDRCIVTPLAGTTRDALDTHYKKYGKNLILTDTAGIRKKAKVKEKIEFYSVMRAIKALERSDVCIIMIDATHGLEAQDVSLIALADRYKKGIVLVVNKWDLIEKNNSTTSQYTKQIHAKLQSLSNVPILFVSTIEKQRIYQVLETAIRVYENRKRKIPTSELNKVMLPVIERYSPPAIKGKYVKIKYITQLPIHTPVFAFFCNLPQYIKPAYKGYLENQLRSNFDLEGVPIKLVFRKK